MITKYTNTGSESLPIDYRIVRVQEYQVTKLQRGESAQDSIWASADHSLDTSFWPKATRIQARYLLGKKDRSKLRAQ